MSPAPARVVVITKPGCHLCDVAIQVVEKVCEELAVDWRADALSALDSQEQQRWADKVPVISVDGTVVDIYRTSAARLRAALNRQGGRG